MKIISNIRVKKYKSLVERTALKCGVDLKVNGYSVVNGKTEIGNNVNFNGLTIVGNGSVKIGNNFHSGQGCYIVSDNHDYDGGDCIPYDSKRSIEKETIIDDNVWLGINVIILAGVHIGEGAIIQAGSVVVNDIEPCAIAGGHPARKFKERNVEHYLRLKEQGKVF